VITGSDAVLYRLRVTDGARHRWDGSTLERVDLVLGETAH
jgi:hypothetical protein